MQKVASRTCQEVPVMTRRKALALRLISFVKYVSGIIRTGQQINYSVVCWPFAWQSFVNLSLFNTTTAHDFIGSRHKIFRQLEVRIHQIWNLDYMESNYVLSGSHEFGVAASTIRFNIALLIFNRYSSGAC